MTEILIDKVIRMRNCMKQLQAKNTGNVYDLEASKDFDDRLQYLVDAGYSYEQIAAMKPIPVKTGHCGWIVEGEFAVEVAKRYGLPIDEYGDRKRAVLGTLNYRTGEFERGAKPTGFSRGSVNEQRAALNLAWEPPFSKLALS